MSIHIHGETPAYKTFLFDCITTRMLNFGMDRLSTVDISFGSLDIEIFPVLTSFSTSFVSHVVFIHHSHFFPLLTLLFLWDLFARISFTAAYICNMLSTFQKLYQSLHHFCDAYIDCSWWSFIWTILSYKKPYFL